MLEIQKDKSYDDNEINEIVNYLSYELILENLKNQINENSGYGSVNYLEIFNEKFNYIILQYGEIQEIVTKVNVARDEFYNIALDGIQNKFSFNLTFKDILMKDELYNIINVLYKFFIININDTLTKFYFNYIRTESKNIIKSFKTQINVKDLYFSILKKKLNKENSILIFSIPKIIDTIEIEFIEDFIEIIIKEDESEYDNFIINKLFNTEEFIDDVLCDIGKLKEIIKRIIKNESIIIQTVKAELYKELVGKEELKC